jgi:hypothetical protein
MTTVLFIFFSYAGFSQKDCDYNPYQHEREEYIQTGREIFEEYRIIDCDKIKEQIEYVINNYYSDTSSIPKFHIIEDIAKVNCTRVIDFFMEVISNDTSERVRCDAIQYLGWLRAKTSISFLLGYTKKDISEQEKINIAFTLCVMEEYDLAIKVLNSFCYDTNGFIKDECIQVYEFAGAIDLAREYYEYYFKKAEEYPEQYDLFHAATKLIEYGHYEKAYPIILAELNSDNKYRVMSALYGLARIGDEKSMDVIREYSLNKEKIACKTAQFILDYIEMKRRKKCKE